MSVHLHVVFFESMENLLEISQMLPDHASGRGNVVHVALDVGNFLKYLVHGSLPDGWSRRNAINETIVLSFGSILMIDRSLKTFGQETS